MFAILEVAWRFGQMYAIHFKTSEVTPSNTSKAMFHKNAVKIEGSSNLDQVQMDEAYLVAGK